MWLGLFETLAFHPHHIPIGFPYVAAWGPVQEKFKRGGETPFCRVKLSEIAREGCASRGQQFCLDVRRVCYMHHSGNFTDENGTEEPLGKHATVTAMVA